MGSTALQKLPKVLMLHGTECVHLVQATSRHPASSTCVPKPRVERHDGGHFVPSKKSWRDFFALYMRSIQQGDDSLVPSPGQSLKVLDDVAKF
ncbi:hypothetical protein VP01_826g1 [Puccinia sorghi]|uniref:Serine hydrolase FSH domain-containing protein n=1 Tax=Puccinia sorghi TaxID=27349 RepID=A0A0L6U9W7_9BASI|nr:hypothetical protein VP01_826g1 [Puccinia sorghi]